MIQVLKLQQLEPGLLRARAERYGLEALAGACGLGLPTLRDMIEELDVYKRQAVHGGQRVFCPGAGEYAR